MATISKDNPELPKAEYRQLGKSGLRVSVPILGAMSFGDKRWAPWVIEEDEVKKATSIIHSFYLWRRCWLIDWLTLKELSRHSHYSK